MNKLIKQIIKFGIVGVIAFLVDEGFLMLFVEVFKWNEIVSGGLSFVISLIVNYLLSMKLVFKTKEGVSKTKEIVIFVVTSVVGLLINILMMYLGTEVWFINYLLVKVIATAIVMVWNFVTKKIFLEGIHKKSPVN